MRKYYLIFILMILLTIISGCELLQKEFFLDVVYSVTGAAILVDITIENEDGGTSRFSDVTIPWSYEFQASKGDFVCVSAINHRGFGRVTVKIYVNGEVFRSSTSSDAWDDAPVGAFAEGWL